MKRKPNSPLCGGTRAATLPGLLLLLMLALMLALVLQSCGGGGGGGGGGDGAGAPQLPLPPGRVSGATPVAAGCTGGGGSGTSYANAEVEPMLARASSDARHLVAAWQQDRWSNGGARAIVSAVSFDGGQSWSRTLHPMSVCGGAARGSSGDFERASDPWVDIGADGTVHVMALAISGSAFTDDGRSAMLASRSTDGGRTFSAPQVLVHDTGAARFNDKNTLTVDALDARYVYAVWDRIEADGNGPTLMARSTDAGVSWEAAREIHRPQPPAGGVAQTIGNRIVALTGGPARGLLVNAFVQVESVGDTSSNTVRVIRSADRGLSWGAPIVVAEHRSVGTRDPATGKTVRDGGILPAVAAAPDGTLWLAWQDARFSGGQRDGIAVSRSIDAGLTWSAPVAANANPGVAAFTPTLAVRADGVLGVQYFDLRPDTTDSATLLAAAWLASTRDATQWSEAAVWNPFDLAPAPDAKGLFLGDYMGLVSDGNAFVPLLALSSTEPGNRTDVYALRVTPALAGRSAPLAATHPTTATRAPHEALPEAEFERRVHAATKAALARRIAGWVERVGPVPDAAPKQ